MEQQIYERALVLFQTKRFDESIRVLNELLQLNPNNDAGLSLMALCYLNTGEKDKAQASIEAAIAIDADDPHHYYLKSLVLSHRDKSKEALKWVDHAISIDPSDPDYFSLRAHIQFDLLNFQASLEDADHALSLDAENIEALNVRSRALLKLKRKEDSWSTIEESLHYDPNNANTHATYAWSLLEKNQVKKSLEHFSESLRLNPQNSYAQAGMMEALKARYAVYRWFLQYSFFMASKGSKYQWGIIIGFSFVFRLVRNLAFTQNGFQPIFILLFVVLFLVAITTWIANPISNLFLRLNKYGEHLLDREEKIEANLVGSALGLSLLSGLSYFVFSSEISLLIAGICFGMMIPLAHFFTEAKFPHATKVYSGIMILTGLTAVFMAISVGEIFNLATVAFIFEFVAFQWIMNFISIERER